MKAAALEDTDWAADADLAILRLALTEQFFTADDLRKVLRPAPVANWVGLAFGRARRAGLIERVSETTSTARSRNHGSLKVWTRTNKEQS